MLKRIVPLIELLACAVLTATAWAQSTQPMPHVEGENLAGHKIALPDDASGKVAVLVFGFTKASKEPTSVWADKILAEYGSRSGFELYQLPVLESVPRFIRGMVISGMKKGAKADRRDHFVPILQEEAALKKLVGYKGPDDAYLVVLNPVGQIVRQLHGPFSDSAYDGLRGELQTMLNH
jgi:hypothetical protein